MAFYRITQIFVFSSHGLPSSRAFESLASSGKRESLCRFQFWFSNYMVYWINFRHYSKRRENEVDNQIQDEVSAEWRGHLNPLLFSVPKSCVFATSTFLADGLVERRGSADGKSQHRVPPPGAREKQGQVHLANSCSSPITMQESFTGQAESAALSFCPRSIGQNLDHTNVQERLGSVV